MNSYQRMSWHVTNGLDTKLFILFHCLLPILIHEIKQLYVKQWSIVFDSPSFLFSLESIKSRSLFEKINWQVTNVFFSQFQSSFCLSAYYSRFDQYNLPMKENSQTSSCFPALSFWFLLLQRLKFRTIDSWLMIFFSF